MCRSRRELSNEYLFDEIGVDTAENEPLKACQQLPKVRKNVRTNIGNCSPELTESCRDTMRSLGAVVLHSTFHTYMRVRSKISFFMLLVVVFTAIVPLYPSLRLNDGGYSLLNGILVCVVCSGHWYGSRINEQQHRTTWWLRRRTEDFRRIIVSHYDITKNSG